MADGGDRKPLWIGCMEQVEWAKLDYAYCETTNVSELIQTIAFADEVKACRACKTLHNELVHQGSIYSSTYEAFPFLIETLAHVAGGGFGRRHNLLWLVEDIVGSLVHWMEREEGDERFAPPDEWLKRPWLGSALFARLLHEDESADVRTYAAYLLGMLLTLGPRSAPAGAPNQYAAVVTALVARLQSNETDELVLSSVVLALGRASVHDLSLIERLREVSARSGVREPTRVAAALALMEIDDSKHANLQDVDLLIDTMCRAAETDSLYRIRSATGTRRRSPWITAPLRFKLYPCLCAWSAGDLARMERVLPALMAGLRRASGYDASADLYHVFSWLWPERHARLLQIAGGEIERETPVPVTPKNLTGLARRVVQACYDNPSIWEPVIGNTTMELHNYGLPESRDGLRKLLDGSTC